MSALKITALKIALWGECNPIIFSGAMTGKVTTSMAGIMAKYLATSLAMLKVVSAPRVMSICLPISTISMSLVGIRVQVDHIAGLFGRLSSGVHGYAHVSLGKGRGVIGPVSGHGHKMTRCLLLSDQLQLVFGSGLGEEIVYSGFFSNSRSGHVIVAGDHDSPDSHGSKALEAVLQASLHYIFQVDYTNHLIIFGHHKSRSA